MKSIVVGNVNGLRQGKRILVTGVTRADTYRPRDGTWRGALDLPHGTAVQAVNIAGRHPFEVGDRLRVDAINGETADVEVIGIRLVETAQLTNADFQAAGYDDHDAYQRDWGDVMGDRLWFYHIKYLV